MGSIDLDTIVIVTKIAGIILRTIGDLVALRG